jgi:hypothetical protein
VCFGNQKVWFALIFFRVVSQLTHSITVTCFAWCTPSDSAVSTKETVKIILLHDDTHPHTANLTKETLATAGWKITNHSPYSPDLAPSDFHLFGPLKLHPGQKFQTDDVLICCVLKWFGMNPFMLLASLTSQEAGKTVLMWGRISWREVRIWWFYHVYSFCKNKFQVNLNDPRI